MARSRVDDEEALIPRSDQEEYHPTTTRNKPGGRCRFCSIKCCFFLFFLLVVTTSILFYFVYPSVVNDNFNKFLGFACGYTVFTPSITCVIMTSQKTLPTQAAMAVNNTWGQHCTTLHYICTADPIACNASLTVPNVYITSDVTTWTYLELVYNKEHVTDWYLIADDTTFVAYGKLASYLDNIHQTEPQVLGSLDTSGDTRAPVVLNTKAVETITGLPEYKKLGQQEAINKTNISVTDTKIYTEYKQDLKDQVSDLKNVSLFTNVTPDKMYLFYVTSSDNV